MKRSIFIPGIMTIMTLALVSCSPTTGEINVSVMFMNNYTAVDDDATMLMVYAWDSASWNDGNPGTPTSASNDGMYMDIMLSATAEDILANKTHSLTLRNLPAGNYYVGVFESSHMNYSTETATLIGYYSTNDPSTMKTDVATEATAVTINSAKPVELKPMMVMPKMEM